MKSFYVENIFDQETYTGIKNYVYEHMEKSKDFNYAPYYGRYWNLIELKKNMG